MAKKIGVYTLIKGKINRDWLDLAKDSVLSQDFNSFDYVIHDYKGSFVQGLLEAVNKLDADYIMRVDADDYLLNKNVLKSMYNEAFYNNADLVLGYPEYSVKKSYDLTNGLIMSCALIKKELILQTPFLSDQEFRDGTSILKYSFLEKKKILLMNKKTFFYRVHEDSLTNSTNRNKQLMIKELDKKIWQS
jgi:hypothetical protein